MTFDPTKPDPKKDTGITYEFSSKVENRIKGLDLPEDTEIAFRALFEEAKSAIQKLENISQRK